MAEANVPGLDLLLGYPIFAFTFTVFCLVALLNSFNLIDGMNGLATGKIILASGAILYLTLIYPEPTVQLLTLAILASMAGLFVLNYPVGRIFLGDTRAYNLGLIGTCLITLKFKYPELSGWAFFLILFWPVTETILSIVRRKIAKKASDRPDMMHMHHLIMRWVESFPGRKISRRISNPLTTAIILPLASIPVAVALLFPEEDLILFAASIFFLGMFILTYIVLLRTQKMRVSKRGPSISKFFYGIVFQNEKNKG